MSPGSVNPGRAASAALAARPIPVSTHAAAPDRDAAIHAQVVDPTSLEVTADATRLDVDDLRRAERDRVGGGACRHDRFVETHGRRRRLGQLGMADDVLFVEGLFDEQQVELVEPAQVLDVDPRVRRVGIDLERHVGSDQLADETHRFEVPAGLDLELDAYVPVVDVALDLAQQSVDGVEDADTDTARDAIVGAAEVRVQAGRVGAGARRRGRPSRALPWPSGAP